MKPSRCFFICCMVYLLIFSLAACNTHGLLSDDFDMGDTVTPEELLEISREIFTETEAPTAKPEAEPNEEATLAKGAIVYWLTTGSVYHAQKDCHHLSKAAYENIHEGTVQKALDEGKERLCSSCAP